MSESKPETILLYADSWEDPKGNDPLFPKLANGSRDLDTEWPRWRTWQEMEKLLETGKTKAIGVSNYSVEYLERLLPHCNVVPAVNQIENREYYADTNDLLSNQLIRSLSPTARCTRLL